MYHPAAALRQGSLKETMLTDMCGLPDVLIASRERRATGGSGRARTCSSGSGSTGCTCGTGSQSKPSPPDVPVEAVTTSLPIEPRRRTAHEDLEATLETAAVVSTASPEPQLELFG